jgi:hypothetical protein
MAVVKKKRPVKKTAKKVPKKRSSKKVEASAPVDEPKKIRDTLTSGHLLQLETIGRDIENAKLLMNVEEQALANMKLNLRILETNIEKQALVVNERSQRYKLLQDRFVLVKKEIWEEYGIKENDGLGYNPKTGEIARS